ncbi:MAG: hypothetical protein Q8Q95_02700 [bacterium]|nr:hypothetical protein [bacterium]
MSLKLIWYKLVGIPIRLGEKLADVIYLPQDTSPALLLGKDYYLGKRVANKKDLVEFSRKYRLAIWFPTIFGVDTEILESPFGPITRVYEIIGPGQVEQTEQNLIRGLPRGSLILFIEDKQFE